jgi:hypothetical protein
MDERQIMQINYFLNFINLKIQNLKEHERHEWISEALSVVDTGLPTHEFGIYRRPAESWSYLKIAQWDEENKLEQCQTLLKELLEEVISNIEEGITLRKDWKPHGQLTLGNTFKMIESKVKFIIQSHDLAGFEGKVVKDGKGKEQGYMRVNRDKLYESKLHISIFTESDEMTLLLTFIQSLEGIKIGFLRKCPECGNWFFHTKKTKKIYCENKCAARKISREKRQKLKETKPRKYKKMIAENAKRARKSYVKKEKQKNPNVKISRRPLKHKD